MNLFMFSEHVNNERFGKALERKQGFGFVYTFEIR